VKIGRSAGDPEQVLLRLDLEQPEPFAVGRPDELAGRRVAAHADAVRGLDKDRRSRADLADDLGVNARISAVLSVGPPRVDVNHRCARFPASGCRLPDLVRLLGNHGAFAVLLHAAVEGDRDHHLVAVEHPLFPSTPR
jgi:hypothetical protein